MPNAWRVMVCVALLTGSGGGAYAADWMLVAPHSGAWLVDSSAVVRAKALPDKQFVSGGITWNITYLDSGAGFDDAAAGAQRRARLEDALAYVADVLNETATIDIEVQPSEFDGNGFLASAGTFYPVGLSGFFEGTTLERVRTGIKPAPSLPEITLTVDFGYNWNESTGTPGADEFDLISVLLHEITHGLGFISLGDTPNNGAYSVLDQFIVRREPFRFLWSGSPPSFNGVLPDLVSNDLAFDGPQGVAGYDQGVRPGIFAPSPFQSGSSLSHWDTGNIVGGAVMESAIAPQTVRREYAPLEIGALRDLGYVHAAAPSLEPPPEGEGAPGCGVPVVHSADTDGDNAISLSELLRVIQFFNSSGYQCAEGTEDGFAPGTGKSDCCPHASDYNADLIASWSVDLTELLRLVQFFNIGAYNACPEDGTEDGYCAGA